MYDLDTIRRLELFKDLHRKKKEPLLSLMPALRLVGVISKLFSVRY